MAELKNVQIFGVGTWNRMKFVQADIDEIVANTNLLMIGANKKGKHKPPLKLGHDVEQVLGQKDGQPALGWPVNFRVSGDLIIVDFEDMPDIVHEIIERKLFRTISAELDHAKNFGWYITAVSLLGADLPAVKSLEDLQAFLIDAIDSSKVNTASLQFSEPHFINTSNIGENKMGDEPKFDLAAQAIVKENEELKVKLAQYEASETASGKKFTETEQELERFRTKETMRSFTEKKETILSPYREDAKAGKLAPVIVDKIELFLDNQKVSFKEGDGLNLSSDLTFEIVKAYSEKLPKDETSQNTSEGDGSETPDVVLERENAKLRAASPDMTWEKADEMLMLTQPKIYTDYFKWSNNIAQGGV